MFALGLMSWLYSRPTEATIAFLERKFASRPLIAKANVTAFKAGWNFGGDDRGLRRRLRGQAGQAAAQDLPQHLREPGPVLRAGRGQPAVGAAAVPRRLPDHPASDILHELSKHKAFGVRTFQAEDEIAGVRAAWGGVRGSLGVTTSSGPGIALKAETIGLAVSLELPLLVVDIQRSGPRPACRPRPSRPTCSRCCSAATARPRCRWWRPAPPRTASTPPSRRPGSLKYRTPVVLLSDGYLANRSEPWLLPDVESLPDIGVEFATEPNHEGDYWPYLRDETTLAGPGRSPGRPAWSTASAGWRRPTGRQHQLRPRQPRPHGQPPGGQGGRDRRRHRAPGGRPPGRVEAAGAGLGSTYGPIGAAVRRVRATGARVSVAHLRHLNPFPANLGEVLAG